MNLIARLYERLLDFIEWLTTPRPRFPPDWDGW